jgi:hypothetical protein
MRAGTDRGDRQDRKKTARIVTGKEISGPTRRTCRTQQSPPLRLVEPHVPAQDDTGCSVGVAAIPPGTTRIPEAIHDNVHHRS